MDWITKLVAKLLGKKEEKEGEVSTSGTPVPMEMTFRPAEYKLTIKYAGADDYYLTSTHPVIKEIMEDILTWFTMGVGEKFTGYAAYDTLAISRQHIAQILLQRGATPSTGWIKCQS